jgi:hypothetical protein
MTSRRILFVVTLALVLSAAGCRNEDNSVPEVELQDRIIATANTTADPSQVLISWFPAPCETFETVEVDLDDNYANLRVKVMVDIAECPEPGPTETVVDLGEPLGDRVIWDRTVGDTVALDVDE